MQQTHRPSFCSESSTTVADMEVPYSNLSTLRKSVIVFVTSFMTVATTFSSTALFPATPEIAASFNTSSEFINITNAAVLLAMGVSPFIWGPVSTLVGRRIAYLGAISVLSICSIAVALAPNLGTFVAMRLLVGLEGAFFMVAGQTLIADLFVPAHRGLAIGFFMSGTVIGPALGPCIGGIIIVFSSWYTIFWVQAGMGVLGLVLSLLVFPPDIAGSKIAEPQPTTSCCHKVAVFNPIRTLSLLRNPSIALAVLAAGFLSFVQFTILIGPRYVINPQYQLEGSITSGLFYIAPGVGFYAGSLLGGQYTDYTVQKWIVIRGCRLPKDRLRSSLPAFLVIIPIAYLIYGWFVQANVGGLAVPIITVLITSMGITSGFNSINLYCTEIVATKRIEVITVKYLSQYVFAAIVNASFLPLYRVAGIGAICSIGVGLSVIGGIVCLLVANWSH